MYKLDLLKFDPVAYVLLVAILGLEIYTAFLRGPDAGALVRRFGAGDRPAGAGSSDETEPCSRSR